MFGHAAETMSDVAAASNVATSASQYDSGHFRTPGEHQEGRTGPGPGHLSGGNRELPGHGGPLFRAAKEAEVADAQSTSGPDCDPAKPHCPHCPEGKAAAESVSTTTNSLAPPPVVSQAPSVDADGPAVFTAKTPLLGGARNQEKECCCTIS